MSMQSKEARAKFKQADELYRSRHYPEALVVLDELDKEFPDVKNILYPRAMCLARVSRYDEALEICRQLKVEFGDPRGEKLMNKISSLRKAAVERERQKKDAKASAPSVPPPNVFTLDSSPPPAQRKNQEFSPEFNPNALQGGVEPSLLGGERLGPAQDALDLGDGSPVIDMAALDDLFAAKPAQPRPVPKAPPPARKGLYVAIGVAAVVIVALIAFAVMASKPAAKPGTPAPASSAEPTPPVAEAVPIQWRNSLEDADAASADNGEPMLLFFYSSAVPSPDVEQIDKYVWGEPTIQHLAKNWVCARIDVESDPEIKESFELQRLPTTVVMDYSEGETMIRKEGSFSAQDFYKDATEQGLVEIHTELPTMPPVALATMPLLFAIATFSPVFLTLLFTGRLPEEEWLTALLTMFLIGIVAPFLGRFVMRAAYKLSYLETMVYYGLFLGHMFAFFLIMSVLIGMPFHLFLMEHMYSK